MGGSLTLDNTPELQAGTYYLAAVNTTGSPVDYTIQASANGSGKTLVTGLSSGDTGRGSAPAGPFLASRQFAVDVPSGVSALRVELAADQNVGLMFVTTRLYISPIQDSPMRIRSPITSLETSRSHCR